MKYFQLLAFLLTAAVVTNAQQLTTSSFYDMHGTLHNPATAGAKGYGSIGGSFRSLWSGMPGAPRTALLFGNAYLKKAKIGIGGYLYNDVTGPLTYNGLQMSYAYHIPMEKGNLSLGVEARVQQFQYDRAKLQQSLGSNDPTIQGKSSRIKGDAGFGVAFTSDNFQIGASVSQLIQSKLNLHDETGFTDEANLSRHFYLHSNYVWEVDKVTRVIPNILFVYLPNAPTEFQGGARVEHNNLFWYGLTWRAGQSWMISAGLRVKEKLNIGYSFDIYTTPLSEFNKGSNGHEIMLRYDFLK